MEGFFCYNGCITKKIEYFDVLLCLIDYSFNNDKMTTVAVTKPKKYNARFHGEFPRIGNIVDGYTYVTVDQKGDAFIIAQHLNVPTFFIWSVKTRLWNEWTGPT
jgi:hypothetical protein